MFTTTVPAGFAGEWGTVTGIRLGDILIELRESPQLVAVKCVIVDRSSQPWMADSRLAPNTATPPVEMDGPVFAPFSPH